MGNNSRTLKVGIAGTGYGGLVHIPGFNACANAEVIAIYGRTQSKAASLAKQHRIEHVCSDFREVVDIDDVDIIGISTPPATHFPYAMEAIKRRKNVLCEKPLALNAAQAAILADAARESGLNHMVGHQIRFHPNSIAVRNILGNQELGKIIHVNLAYSTSNRLDKNAPWNWWSDAEAGGGELNAIGSHQIDLLRWWLGDIVSVSGRIKTAYPQRKDPHEGHMKAVTADDMASFNLHFQGDIMASCIISSVAAGWKGFSIQIYGEQGAIFWEGEHQLTMVRKSGAKHDLTSKDKLLTESWVSGSIWRASFKRMADNFIEAIRNGGDMDGATFEDGAQVQRAIDCIRLAHREERTVGLDEISPKGAELIEAKA